MFSRHETLKKAYDLLTLFNQDNDLFHFTQSLLSVLNYIDASAFEDISALRTEINLWIKNNPQAATRSINKILFSDVLHSFLIAMAAAKPINLEDPITQDVISEFKRIVTSDGYQFDAEPLVRWIKTKGTMVNPFTNVTFAEKDKQEILAFIAGNNVSIEHTDRAPEQTISLTIQASFFRPSYEHDRYSQVKWINNKEGFGFIQRNEENMLNFSF